MAKDFNVPPVVFPSGTSVLQRRSTAPFQPPPSSANIPFLSFDVSSAAAAATTSGAPPPYTSHASASFEDEPPLLEELGINTKQIYQKTLSILNPIKINHHLHERPDLSGPFLLLMAFGLFQLLGGKFHFGIILGWVTMASMFLYVVFNMLAGRNQGNLDMFTCLSLIGYSILPIVMLSALSLFVPQGGTVVITLAGLLVMWSARVCTRLVVELASCGDEHRGLIARKQVHYKDGKLRITVRSKGTHLSSAGVAA